MKALTLAFTGKALALVATVFCFASPASAQPPIVFLDFEGIPDNAQIDTYYDGGTFSVNGIPGTLMGPDFDVTFGADSRATRAITPMQGVPGTGDFINAPSPDTVLFFRDNSAILNYSSGFTTGFSFFYTAADMCTFPSAPGGCTAMLPLVTVWDAPNGTGNMLAEFGGTSPVSLAFNWRDGCETVTEAEYCNWDPVGAPFDGTAMSIVFSGDPNFIGFDNITFGSVNPVPLPPGGWLLLSGLLGLAVLRRRASAS